MSSQAHPRGILGSSFDFRRLTRREQIRRMRRAARFALREFAIDPVTVSLIAHHFNTTFEARRRNGSRYVLHILRPDAEPVEDARLRARVESELWWVDRVGAALDLRVPLPVRAPSGSGVVGVTLEDETSPRLCTLFHWVAGRFLRERILPVHLHAVGRMTARLHEHSEALAVPRGFDRPRVDGADRRVEEAAASVFASGLSRDAAGTIRQAFRLVRETQSQLGSGNDVFGLIHADIHQKNYLFRRGEVGLIDFGDCGWGHFLYDFAVTLNELRDLPNYPELRAALLAGYRQIRALSADHEVLIDVFIVLRQVQDVTWFLRERDDPTYSRSSEQIAGRVAAIQQELAGLGAHAGSRRQ